MDRPSSVSTVCQTCGTMIKPEALKAAEQTRIDRDDGGYSLQYDHPDGECPMQIERRINATSAARQVILGASR